MRNEERHEVTILSFGGKVIFNLAGSDVESIGDVFGNKILIFVRVFKVVGDLVKETEWKWSR